MDEYQLSASATTITAALQLAPNSPPLARQLENYLRAKALRSVARKHYHHRLASTAFLALKSFHLAKALLAREHLLAAEAAYHFQLKTKAVCFKAIQTFRKAITYKFSKLLKRLFLRRLQYCTRRSGLLSRFELYKDQSVKRNVFKSLVRHYKQTAIAKLSGKDVSVAGQLVSLLLLEKVLYRMQVYFRLVKQKKDRLKKARIITCFLTSNKIKNLKNNLQKSLNKNKKCRLQRMRRVRAQSFFLNELARVSRVKQVGYLVYSRLARKYLRLMKTYRNQQTRERIKLLDKFSRKVGSVLRGQLELGFGRLKLCYLALFKLQLAIVFRNNWLTRAFFNVFKRHS